MHCNSNLYPFLFAIHSVICLYVLMNWWGNINVRRERMSSYFKDWNLFFVISLESSYPTLFQKWWPTRISILLFANHTQVHSKTPPYKHIYVNQCNTNHWPKCHDPRSESCKFHVDMDSSSGNVCDRHCFNRMICIECVGDSTKVKRDKDPYWNWNYGPDYGN